VSGVQVVTDSASDLPEAVLAELGIVVVPLTIRIGENDLVEGKDLTPTQFWERCASSPTLPETAAPAPGAFAQAFSRAADAGSSGVICVTMSGAMSGTFDAARAGATTGSGSIPIRVIDSRSVTMGQGLTVMAAARMAAEGKRLDQVAEAVEDLALRTRVYGALGGLDHLKKGGRIGGAQAFLGSLLSIKPIIEVRNGRVEAESRQRTRARSLDHLVDKVRQHSPIEHLAVMHGNAPDLDDLLARIGTALPDQDILVGDLGPVVGAHTGPGTIGVTFHTTS